MGLQFVSRIYSNCTAAPNRVPRSSRVYPRNEGIEDAYRSAILRNSRFSRSSRYFSIGKLEAAEAIDSYRSTISYDEINRVRRCERHVKLKAIIM